MSNPFPFFIPPLGPSGVGSAEGPAAETAVNLTYGAFEDQRQENAQNAPTATGAAPATTGTTPPQEDTPESRAQARADILNRNSTDVDNNYASRIMTPGYSGNVPNFYWVMGSNGQPVKVEVPEQIAIDYEAEANAKWEALSPTDQIQQKWALYYAGFYPDDYIPITNGLAMITPEDRLAMANSVYFNDQNKGITYDNMMLQMANAGYSSGTPYLQGGSLPPTAADKVKAQQVYTTTEVDVRNFLLNNGIDVSDQFVKNNAAAIAEGRIDPDTWKAQVRSDYIANAYPGLRDRILAGEDLATIANPYVEAYASTMGLDSSEVDVANPVIRKAMQYTDESGKPTMQPLWKFQEDLTRSDEFKNTATYQRSFVSLVDEFKNMMGN